MPVINGIHKLSDILDKLMEIVIVFMLGAMVVITFLQIVSRIFFTAIPWTEEATRYLLIWGTLFGAGCVYKHGGHISVSLLSGALPEKPKKLLQLVVHLLCLLLFSIIVVNGVRYFGKQGNQLSAALRLPMRYVYLCIPCGAGIMIVHALDAALRLFFPEEKKTAKGGEA